MEIKLKIKELVEKIKAQFNRLEKRQRTLVLVLAAAVIFSFYYNAVYKQQSGALKRAKAEVESVNNSAIKLKSQIPDIDAEKDALNSAGKRLDFLKTQLSSLEAQLPRYGRVPQLLAELVAQASGYGIDFVSIKPKTTQEKKDYSELTIEMKFNAAYPDFVNYLNHLESMSQFLKAGDIAIEEIKDGFRGQLSVTLAFTTLLGQAEFVKEEEGPQKIVPALAVERSPFLSKFRTDKGGEKKDELRLSGIIAGGREPTAIINDEVYKAGDYIGNKRVKQILPNMVVLTDGRQSIVLTLER